MAATIGTQSIEKDTLAMLYARKDISHPIERSRSTFAPALATVKVAGSHGVKIEELVPLKGHLTMSSATAPSWTPIVAFFHEVCM